MCRFKGLKNGVELAQKLFQYIICVGSRSLKKRWEKRQKSFNTSYVSVQEISALEEEWIREVSIHHMCRFK